MTPTTLPRLGSQDEFALRSAQSPSVETAHRHLAAHRRVPLGAGVSVVFEDRQTVWFRVQELSRYARAADRPGVRRELAWYKRLMPGGGRVRAAVWLNARGRAAGDTRDAIGRGRLVLRSSAGHRVAGDYLPQQVTDRLIGLVRWVEFLFTDAAREALHDSAVEWRLCLDCDGDEVLAAAVDESVLESLSADVG
jgi:hypothetical protein